jgi:cytochrome P450
MLWFPSGSRDEAVFDNPDTFDPHRDTSTRHASFGHGAHICLGMHLARQENAAFLAEFARRVKSIELTGEPEFNHSHFVGGIKHLPIRLELES